MIIATATAGLAMRRHRRLYFHTFATFAAVRRRLCRLRNLDRRPLRLLHRRLRLRCRRRRSIDACMVT